jgi:uncharacterized RmlC-like cupin family protein
VRAGESCQGKQGPDYTPGISAESVGAHALWLGSVTLPPEGGRTKAHVHESHGSAYLVSGDEVELYTGDNLERREWPSTEVRRLRCSSGRARIRMSRRAS